jgi:hypothetical protein
MFSSNHTNVWAESDYTKATSQNLKLTLHSMRGELLGDPYFGMLLEKFLFEQNDYLTRDLLTDMIYNQVALFIPQLKVYRRDISVFPSGKKGQVVCQIHGTNQLDFKPETHELLLFKNENT